MEGEEQQEQVAEEKTEETSSESPAPQKTNSLPVVLLVFALLAVVGFVAYKGMKSSKNDDDKLATTIESSLPSAAPSQTPSGPVKEFTVDGSNFKFSPNKITVKKGDNVKITFKDDDGFHNLVVDGYNVQTNTIKSGDSDSVTFVADKTGTFQYYCAVDSHREKGMVGTLVVQ